MGADLKTKIFHQLDLFINKHNELVLREEIGKNYNKGEYIKAKTYLPYIDKIKIAYCPICGRKLKEEN